MKNDDFEKLKEMLEEDREPTPALLRAGKRYKELVGEKMKINFRCRCCMTKAKSIGIIFLVLL